MHKALTTEDYKYLEQCLQLAEEALHAGDKPFGSIIVSQDGKVLATARNRVNEINVIAHPEYELADWALNNLSWQERVNATLYTSGEHCPMCAGAHAWAEIGTVAYIISGSQLVFWLKELNLPDPPIRFLPIEDIVKNIIVKGPAEGKLLERIRQMQMEYFKKQ